jgi:hypothetical protein
VLSKHIEVHHEKLICRRTKTLSHGLNPDETPQKIPNPHGADISVDLLARILRQAGISREEWLNAR